MKKLPFLLVTMMAVGCGESQLDRRAKLEIEENSGNSAGVNEELEANEEAVETPKATPKSPQAKKRPGDGQAKSRPGQGQRPGGRGNFGRRNPYEGLDLSEEQQEKINAMQEEQRAEMGKLFEQLRGGGADRQAMGEKMTALREKYQKQADAILNDEQKKKMAEMRAQQPQGGRGQGGRGQGGRGQGGRGNQFSALGVNETQQKKLDAARQELSTKMRELFTDRDVPREEREPKIEKLREAYEAQLKEVLTEEQYQKFKESQGTRGSRSPGQGKGPGQSKGPGQGGGRPERAPQPKKNE